MLEELLQLHCQSEVLVAFSGLVCGVHHENLVEMLAFSHTRDFIPSNHL